MGRKRKYYIRVRFTKDELEQLNCDVKLTGLSREAYMRMLVNDIRPVTLPSKELVEVVKELRKIGTNINQIAHRLNLNENIDKSIYSKNYKDLQDRIDQIMMAINNAFEN